MIRRYAAATALAAGLAATAVAPATAETTAPTTTSPSTSSSQDASQPSSGQAFSSEIKPGHVTSIFSSLVSLATAIFGFIGKVV